MQPNAPIHCAQLQWLIWLLKIVIRLTVMPIQKLNNASRSQNARPKWHLVTQQFAVTQITKIKLPARHSNATLKSPTALMKSASQILERTLNTARLPIKPVIHPPLNFWTQPLLPNVQPRTLTALLLFAVTQITKIKLPARHSNATLKSPTAPLEFAVTNYTKIFLTARHSWQRNQPPLNVMLTSTTALLIFAPVLVKTLTTAKKSALVIMLQLHALGLFASHLLVNKSL